MDLSGINNIYAYYNPYAFYGVGGLQSSSPLSALNALSGIGQSQNVGSLVGISASSSTSLSGLGKSLSDISSLQFAATKLTEPSVFSGLAVSSSASGVAQGTAAPGTAQGGYAVQVNQLAQGQVLTSAAQATKYATIGSGADTTATFQFASGRSAQVNFTGSDNSVQGLANAINGANIGVTASVVSSPAGYQLQLTGQSGAGNAFSISASGDATLAQFISSPPGSSGLALTQQAQDATGTVNGTAFTGSTNTVATGVDGLTLKLNSTGSATLNVATNPDQTTAITDFVKAYNTLQGDLSGLAQTYPGFGITAPFLRSGLSAALTPGSPGSNGISSLADIGITANANGTLSVNENTLRSALTSQPAAVANLFSNSDGKGVADQVLAQVGDNGSLSVTNLLQTAAPALSSANLVNSLFSQQQQLLSQLNSLSSLTSSLSSTSLLLNGLLGNSSTDTSGLNSTNTLASLTTLNSLSTLLAQQSNQSLAASLLFGI